VNQNKIFILNPDLLLLSFEALFLLLLSSLDLDGFISYEDTLTLMISEEKD